MMSELKSPEQLRKTMSYWCKFVELFQRLVLASGNSVVPLPILLQVSAEGVEPQESSFQGVVSTLQPLGDGWLYMRTDPSPEGRVNSLSETPMRRSRHCRRSVTVKS